MQDLFPNSIKEGTGFGSGLRIRHPCVTRNIQDRKNEINRYQHAQTRPQLTNFDMMARVENRERNNYQQGKPSL